MLTALLDKISDFVGCSAPESVQNYRVQVYYSEASLTCRGHVIFHYLVRCSSSFWRVIVYRQVCAVLGSPVLVIGCGSGASLNFLLNKLFPRRCFSVYIALSTESYCSVFIVVDNCEWAVSGA